VLRLSRNRILLLPLAAGIILLSCSWFTSYPLSIDSLTDYVFNHVSPLYWIGLSLILATLFLAGVTSKSDTWKCIITISLIMAMFSISYFYYMVPGSDSQFFRGLNEYFISTSRTPSEPSHTYFEWPLFFIVNDIATSVTGLALFQFEFVNYSLIGFLSITALYKYFARSYRNGALLAVACFFIGMFYFLNYQAVPFSLAFALFLLLLMIGDRITSSLEGNLVAILLFTGIAFSHAFVPLFFVFYEFVWYLFSRDKAHLRLSSLTLAIYFAVQIFQTPLSLTDRIRGFLETTSEYGKIVQATLKPATIQLDVVAQSISRLVVISALIICISGFLMLVIRKKIKNHDKVLFVTGAVYSALGAMIQVLGSRAIPILFIPICVGICYLFGTKLKKCLISLLLVLLILFPFIQLHLSFEDDQLMFQTKESYIAENFMIERYNWTVPSLVLAHTRVSTYLRTKQNGQASFESDFSPSFPRINNYDCIFYTVGLGKNLLKYNFTLDKILGQEMLNRIYDDRASQMIIKSWNLSRAPVFR
jgi:hypothetical protein